MINLILQGVAVWLLYHYMYNSPKKQFREVSLILVTVGTCLVALVLGIYLPMVTLTLNSIKASLGTDWFLDVSDGTGVSVGYWLMWLSVIIQVVQIILYKHSKITDERRLVELKMQEQFEAELA